MCSSDLPLSVVHDVRYKPRGLGGQAKAQVHGFVVRRDAYLVPSDGGPLRHMPAGAGDEIVLEQGGVIEERIELVNTERRHHVAVVVPLAAGMEPLNPALEGAPTEATPTGRDSVAATYRDVRDDAIAWFFDTLPEGALTLHFRTRAVTRGRFGQPPARAELMYDQAQHGQSHGAFVRVIAAKAAAR